MVKKLLSLSLFVLISYSTYAGGYRVSMQGNKQLAMGHTGVAVVNGAETLFFNPAASVFLKDTWSFSAGVSYLVADIKFENKTYNWKEESKNPGTPMYAYAAYKPNDWISVGLAIYTPFGSKVDWEHAWEGGHLVNNIDLKSFYIQPTIAIKVNERFSFAGGPIFVSGSVSFNRNVSRSLTNQEGEFTNVTVKSHDVTAWGWTAGYLLNVTDHLRIGMNYRSEIKMSAKNGSAIFNNVPSYAESIFKDGKITAELPLPAELSVGASYEVGKWLFAFDYNRVFWKVYDALTIDFVDSPAIGKSVNPRNYKDSSVYRLGAQYTVNEQWSVRAGWYYDQSPVQDGYFAPETPRNDSRAYTGGFTYKFKNGIGIDVAANFMNFSSVENSYDYYQEDGNNVSFGGVYKSAVTSGSIGISYSF